MNMENPLKAHAFKGFYFLLFVVGARYFPAKSFFKIFKALFANPDIVVLCTVSEMNIIFGKTEFLHAEFAVVMVVFRFFRLVFVPYQCNPSQIFLLPSEKPPVLRIRFAIFHFYICHEKFLLIYPLSFFIKVFVSVPFQRRSIFFLCRKATRSGISTEKSIFVTGKGGIE